MFAHMCKYTYGKHEGEKNWVENVFKRSDCERVYMRDDL